MSKQLTSEYYELAEFLELILEPEIAKLKELRQERDFMIVKALSAGTSLRSLIELTGVSSRRIYQIRQEQVTKSMVESEQEDRIQWRLAQYREAIEREQRGV